jgi:hypothetical protein
MIRNGSWIVLAAALISGGSISLFATRAEAQEAGANDRPDAARVPFDAVAFLSIKPQSILQSDMAAGMPRETMAVAAREQLGIELNEVQRIDMIFGMPTPAGIPLGAVVTSAKPISIEDLSDQVLASRKPMSFGKVKGYPLRAQPNLIIVPLDEKHLLVGMSDYVERMASRVGSGGQLQQLIPQIKSWGDLQLIVGLDDVRPMLAGSIDGMQANLPPKLVADLRTLVNDVDHIEIRADIRKAVDARIALVSDRADGGPGIAESWNRVMAAGRQMMLASLESQQDPSMSPAFAAALKSDMARISQTYVEQFALQGSGNRAEIEGTRTDIATTGVLVALLLPAVQSAREAARQAQATNQLRQIGLAMHNYAAEHGGFPPAAIVDEDGNPLLSWRVALLPYLDQAELYAQFHLDEPWDSEHNAALIEQMPAIYRHPSSPAPPGQTVLLAVVGEGVGLSPDEVTPLEAFGRELSSRILVLQVPEMDATYWTAPEEFDARADEENQISDDIATLIANPDFKFQAVFADGSARRLDMSTDDALIQHALFTDILDEAEMAEDTPPEDE